MNRTTWVVIGFILLFSGFLSLVLGLVGLSFQPLGWIDQSVNPLGAMFIKLLLIIAGFIVFYVNRTSRDADS